MSSAADESLARFADRSMVLSTLWVFVMFHYLYLDLVMMIFRPEVYSTIAEKMPWWVALLAAALMEVLIAMVLLSRILKYRANRLANIIGGIIATLFVAITISRTMPAFAILYTTVEIACTLFIIWYAWTWKGPSAETIVTKD
jgi:hypothetical protein